MEIPGETEQVSAGSCVDVVAAFVVVPLLDLDRVPFPQLVDGGVGLLAESGGNASCLLLAISGGNDSNCYSGLR